MAPVYKFSNAGFLGRTYKSVLAENSVFSPLPPSSYDLLETATLTEIQATVNFSNLISAYGSSYQHLQIRYVAKDNRNFYNTSGWYMQFNNDSGSNYTGHVLYGDGSAANSYNDAAWTNASLVIAANSASNNSETGQFAAGIVDILDPFENTKYTTSRARSGNVPGQLAINSHLWNSTAAIDSISIIQGSSNQFISGSRFSLYGLKAA